MEQNKRVIDGPSGVESDAKKPKFEQYQLTPAERASKVIQEKDVGITQYLNDLNSNGGGFYGTIKQRYSDFLVNEIDTKGNVVHLADEGVDLGKSKRERRLEQRQKERSDLQDKTQEEVEEIKEAKRLEEEQKPKYELSEENKTKLLEFITLEELAQIEELFSTGNNMETKSQFPEKQSRGKLHQLFRESFQNKLETITSPENTFKIALAKNSSNPRRPRTQESINHVDENGVINYGLGHFKHYLHFTVYKENKETMEIASTISKFLRIPSKSIRYAGTKDRRGVTAQRFSIHKGKVARVSSLNKGLRGAVLGGFTYEDQSLSLGDLLGNEFVITIRDAKTFKNDNSEENVEDVVAKCFDSLKTKGFINYYGMQRFGTFSISTHSLGIHILQEDWKGAAELILSEQEIVSPDSVEARKIWAETSNPSLTLKKMPRRCTAEHSILSVLEREPLNSEEQYSSNSYFKAIMSIPRNLRIMYAHAYQSYVWNQVVSKRVELFGLEVQVGDLVIDNRTEKEKREAEGIKDEEDDEDFEEDVATNTFIRARALTKEDIESGKFSIYDVVLPTPGFDIKYPTNPDLEKVYVEVMAKDNLDPHSMGRKVREFSLAGSYRNIITKPEKLSYDIVKYTDPSQPLIRTDLELLRLKKEAEEKGEVDFVPKRTIEGQLEEGAEVKTAVVLRIQLGVSAYATMALREFMKADTSRLSDNLNVNL
ncbi:multisubstrate pseudouridine synthase 7 [[Candida] railenensis]|uniref:Multisubstrate pseudouridine synthase 7 n=1 Tax=[Candida] railenensis TaxID=45579 RepID=A0A9P0QU11_9ASCO|nr:multisubstrate pseudouridine synthase 7 [[Candida] railenensis]